MNSPVAETIPVVDLRDYVSQDPELRVGFIDTLGAGLERFGFVAVTGHGIPEDLLEAGYSVARRAFSLPLSTKLACETPQDGRQRGYTAFGVEHARDQALPDLKEFWHVGRELAPEHPLRVSGDVPCNLFPREVPEFKYITLQLFRELEAFAGKLLTAVAEYLELPSDTFRHMVRDGNSVLRIIHYPPMGPHAVPGAVRAAQHEDINLLTVLPASTTPGLELLTREGQWLAVHCPPGVMVCDTGDMMALLTGGRLPATTHRVVNPAAPGAGARLSMPFFLHPHPDQVLAPFDGDGPAVRTRDFLMQRLREIGVA